LSLSLQDMKNKRGLGEFWRRKANCPPTWWIIIKTDFISS